MQIRYIRLDDLIPYENNPRKNDDAVAGVAASIREFGFRVPIIVDKDNVIIAGHTRLKAAKQLGLETVPVIRADDLTEEQVKAFRLADNKTAELAGWDFTAVTQGRFLWLRNNVTTIICNCLENFGFIYLAFLGIYDAKQCLEIAVTTSIIEIIVALCDTPFVYLATKTKNTEKIA